jgi:hypothetical protein
LAFLGLSCQKLQDYNQLIARQTCIGDAMYATR